MTLQPRSLQPRLRTIPCDVCKQPFMQTRLMQKVCPGWRCASKLPRMLRRKERAEDRRKLMTRQDWLKLAEKQVNAYVRARDAALPCISCDRPASWQGQWHASHFRSVKAASAIRYNLWNIHKACSVCNAHLSGNLSEYEPRLKAKIGDAKVAWLRAQNQVVRYKPEYLERLADVFRRKTKREKAKHD